MHFRRLALAAVAALIAMPVANAAPELDLQPNDKIVIVGNTLAERETYFGHLETHLHARFPDHKLTVRNLGWSADTITMRLRSLDFHDHGHTLRDEDPDVIFAMFGFNESFAGKEGLEQFKTDLKSFLDDLARLRYETRTVDGGRDGKRAGSTAGRSRRRKIRRGSSSSRRSRPRTSAIRIWRRPPTSMRISPSTPRR